MKESTTIFTYTTYIKMPFRSLDYSFEKMYDIVALICYYQRINAVLCQMLQLTLVSMDIGI